MLMGLMGMKLGVCAWLDGVLRVFLASDFGFSGGLRASPDSVDSFGVGVLRLGVDVLFAWWVYYLAGEISYRFGSLVFFPCFCVWENC